MPNLTLRHQSLWLALVATLSMLMSGALSAQARDLKKLAILQVEIEDNTTAAGELPWHRDALHRFTNALGSHFNDAGLYSVIDQHKVDAAARATYPGAIIHTCNGCELDIARKVGADHVMVAWIYKMSLLVMALHVEIKDVATGATIYRKTFDFKGDNETAWHHAGKYMVRAFGETAMR